MRFSPTSRVLNPNDPNYETTLQIHWLGAACYVIQLGDRVIFTDPFFTHHSFAHVLVGGTLRSDSTLVANNLKDLPVPSAIFVGHSHYDHLLDAAACLAQPAWKSVPMYGSESTRNVLCGSGPEFTNTWREVMTNSDWQFVAPGIRYKAMAVTHARQARFFPLAFPGNVEQCRTCARASCFKVGDTYAFLFELSNKRATNTVYFIGAAHHADESFRPDENTPPNVAILCVPGWSHVRDYPGELMRKLRPSHVIASHYDDFFETKKGTPKVVVLGDLEGFLAKAQAAATYTNFQSIVVPAVGAVMQVPK